MASNDMNSWDDDPDELLRRHWQQAFDDFEVQPRSSLSRRILNQLPAGRRRRPIRWLVAGLLLLMTAGLLYQVRFSERSGTKDKNNIAQSASPHRSTSKSRVLQPTTSAERPLSPALARTNSRSDEVTASQRPTTRRPSASRIETPGVSAPLVASPQVETEAGFLAQTRKLTKRTDKIEFVTTSNVALRSETRKTRRNAPTLTSLSRSKSPRTTADRSPATSSGLVRSERVEPDQAPREVSASQDALSDSQVATNYLSVGTSQFLRIAGLLSLPGQLGALPAQLPVTDSVSRYRVEDNGVRPTQRWFIDAVPLSSFQWMSALPASASYLSQVHAPAAFSPATWGYQVNGGVRFGRWQAHLSMGQLRRWAYYTVNENRYRVEPNPANPYHLVREAHTVAENVALPMVGAGLSQYRLLGQGRYAIELGGQFSYLPTSRQTLLGLRGGVNRRLPLSHRLELQASVVIEYGLNRLLSEQRQLAIHPVVVGFGVRIQPRLEKP
ncbi:hypothetical protein [Spirosoma validum]|uniref:Uncharacterized protein n=1 Tax=Spirosoma validum TaxID=2771355 RepID=A0A927B902_9BACT|nr:hypothetical protein [Spirosoma validum]MBD2757458.1 hypothetical protein [Spirosoma validum]